MLHLQAKKSLRKQVSWQIKNLVAVSATSMLMNDKKTEEEELERVSCIWYSVNFKDQTEALLDSGSEVNVMNLAFASQLGLKLRKTNIRA